MALVEEEVNNYLLKSPIPNPQSPIPNPQYKKPLNITKIKEIQIKYFHFYNLKLIILINNILYNLIMEIFKEKNFSPEEWQKLDDFYLS